jgi:hypothetical protein
VGVKTGVIYERVPIQYGDMRMSQMKAYEWVGRVRMVRHILFTFGFHILRVHLMKGTWLTWLTWLTNSLTVKPEHFNTTNTKVRCWTKS